MNHMPLENKKSEKEEEELHRLGKILMEPEHEWSENAAAQQKALIQMSYLKTNPAAIPYLLKALRATNHSEVTGKAAHALGQLSHHAIPALTEIIDSKNEKPETKKSAIEALGWMRYRKAFPTLVKALQHEDPRMRVLAAQVLGKKGRTQAIPHLAERIREDSDHDVIRNAAHALGEIGHASAIKPLTEAVTGYFDPGITQAAFFSMGQIGDSQALPLLLQRMSRNMKPPEDVSRAWTYDPNVRNAAAEAVYKILEKARERRPGGKSLRDENVKKLLPVHEHVREEDDSELKAHAYQAALEGKVTEKNARLYLKQLRALEGKVK